MPKSISIHITGRVQGVGFRYHTRNKAQEFNIKGFAKNEPDGSVYIEAEGEEPDLEQFMDWCRSGPRLARVDSFCTKPIPLKDYTGFAVK